MNETACTLVRLSTATFCVLSTIFFSSNAFGDDTEIFQVSSKPTPKVMMLLDTSRSMKNQVGSTGKSRLTTMQESVETFVKNAENIDIGLVRMNENTGAIIYPATNLSVISNDKFTRFNRPASQFVDMAAEYGDDNKVKIGTNINKFNFSKNKSFAVRFNKLPIDGKIEIDKAFIEFTPHNVTCDKDNCPQFKMTVYGENTAHSAPYSDIKSNISKRPKTSKLSAKTYHFNGADQSLNWHKSLKKPVVRLNGLEDIINKIIKLPNWESGNSLSFIVDTSSISSNKVGGISSTTTGLTPVLFVKMKSEVSRQISGKDKLIEELYNQRLSYFTPTVPALFDTVKYLAGGPLNQSVNEKFNLKRNGITKDNYWRYYERISHPDSFSNATIRYPANCFQGWESSYACKDIEIIPSLANVNYISPLTNTCEEVATIILLTDGFAYHNKNSDQSGHWWANTINEMKSFSSPTLSCNSSLKGDVGKGYPLSCSQEFVTSINQGFNVSGSLHKKRINIHTIGFTVSDNWLENIAEFGGGQYFEATDSVGLRSAFNAIHKSVLSKTTTFSSAPVAIDSTNRLNHNNDLYFTLFQPTDKTIWQGNLKRYKVSSGGNIIDADGDVAFNNTIGEFQAGSKSYWSNEADGNDILLGGARNHLTTNRRIFINDGTKVIRMSKDTAFTDKFSLLDFNVPNNTERDSLIDQMLSSTHISDPLHSNPVVVTYPDKAGVKQNSVVFFGDNQGYIHAIDTVTGEELYSFMPKILLKNQKRIFEQAIGTEHIYGIDGKITTWTHNRNRYVTVGMRRGGTNYYTLNVTNRSTPKLAYIISPERSGYSALGQTWSSPKVVNVKQGNTVIKALLFGGGYDESQDNTTTRKKDSKGDGVYLVNAVTGNIISSQTNLDYSIPSDVKAIDLDGDSVIDQVYVGDMGGRLLRFDITNQHKLSTAVVIANIADDSVSGNRRFYNAPDVSILKGSNNTKLAVAIGSGFRAHPKNTAINDRFYLFKQNIAPENSPTIIDHSSSALIESSYSVDNEKFKTSKGWYFDLGNSNGEKVLASSTTADNTIWFTSFKPTINSGGCSVGGGTSKLYRVNVSNGLANYKNTLPEKKNGQVVADKQCGSNAVCTIEDRSIELKNMTIPPAPVLIHVPRTSEKESGSMLCVGTMCNELAPREVKSTFWREVN